MSHYSDWWYARNPEKYKLKRKSNAYDCAHCGKAHRSGRKDARFCSVRCYNLAAGNRVDVKRAESYQAKRREHRRTRRARLKSVHVERVDDAKVYAADGYRCYLCHQMTDRSKLVPHPKAPTIDHVVPLSKGGEHSMANCRTAHHGCNLAKGNRGGGEQLAIAL